MLDFGLRSFGPLPTLSPTAAGPVTTKVNMLSSGRLSGFRLKKLGRCAGACAVKRSDLPASLCPDREGQRNKPSEELGRPTNLSLTMRFSGRGAARAAEG